MEQAVKDVMVVFSILWSWNSMRGKVFTRQRTDIKYSVDLVTENWSKMPFAGSTTGKIYIFS